MSNDFVIEEIFPCPVYFAHRNSDLDLLELEDVKSIVDDEEEGMHVNQRNSISNNTYIFNTKLKKIKEFCEKHIKIYVKEVINPKEELNFYITQSWLNLTEPGESHHRHWHSNSLISGIFYITTTENDKVQFYDPNATFRHQTSFEVANYNIFNSQTYVYDVNSVDLFLFPSWLEHSVEKNEKATRNRISISFNVCVKGIMGTKQGLNELILK